MNTPRLIATFLAATLLVTTAACSLIRPESNIPPSGTDNTLEGVVRVGTDNSTLEEPSALAPTVKYQEAQVRALAKMQTLNYRQKLGQLFMVGYADRRDAEDLIEQYNVGNLVLMSRNDESAQTIKQNLESLQALAISKNGSGLLVSVDQEGGKVQRLRQGFSQLPSARQSASSGDLAEYAKTLSNSLLAIGINMNLSPVLDIDYGRASIVGSRAFGTTPTEVDAASEQYLTGANSSGIVSTLKHYPGHGSASADSHHELPFVDKSLDEIIAQDLLPFSQNIKRGLVESVMVGSIAFPKIDSSNLPASLSETMVNRILRSQLGYNGLVVTDDAGMGALKRSYTDQQVVTLAINASVDIVLCVRQEEATSCNQRQFVAMYNHLDEAVRSGIISQETINKAVLRVLTLKAQHGLL